MSGRDRERRRREDLKGLLLLALALSVILALGAGFALLQQRRVATDARDCPTGAPLPENRVLLFDGSDRLDVVQQEWVEARLGEWIGGVPRHGRVRLYALTQDARALSAGFDRCNPGSGEDESFWVANPGKLKRRWKSLFAAPADDALQRLPSGPLERSPLLENLQILAVRAQLEPGEAAARRSLLLVSDLLQHSQAFSHYTQGCADPSAFIASESFGRVRGDLRGLEIEVLYIQRERPAGCTVSDHVNWWDAVFEASGADLVRVRSAPGTAPTEPGERAATP